MNADLRARLVGALIENRDRDYPASVYKFTPGRMADALLPLVEKAVADARAEALREAADAMPFGQSHAAYILRELAEEPLP